MRILFVHPATEMSIGDVARGYRAAMERRGHDMQDYRLANRFAHHRKAAPELVQNDPALMSRLASENVINEALYHEADLVMIVSGLNLHPIVLWLLGKVGIPVAVIFTESPYEDESQSMWANISHTGVSQQITIFTNDLYSAMANGWHYLPPSFDPAVHRPTEPNPATACDVMMIGTGWGERKALLEGINWDGIDLRLYGIWPGVDMYSPLHPYYRPMVVPNVETSAMYCSAKICLNYNRHSATALTPGPRVYEVAACGAFQVSDPRQEMVALFGAGIPTYRNSEELEHLIRYYLDRPDERVLRSAGALDRVITEDFDHRAAELEAVLLQQPQLVGKGD